jgi:hypothetical protein
LEECIGDFYPQTDRISASLFQVLQYQLSRSYANNEWSEDKELQTFLTFVKNKEGNVSVLIKGLGICLPLYKNHRTSNYRLDSFTPYGEALTPSQKISAQLANRLWSELPEEAFRKGVVYRLQNSAKSLDDSWNFITGANMVLIYPREHEAILKYYEGLLRQNYATFSEWYKSGQSAYENIRSGNIVAVKAGIQWEEDSLLLKSYEALLKKNYATFSQWYKEGNLEFDKIKSRNIKGVKKGFAWEENKSLFAQLMIIRPADMKSWKLDTLNDFVAYEISQNRMPTQTKEVWAKYIVQ